MLHENVIPNSDMFSASSKGWTWVFKPEFKPVVQLPVPWVVGGARTVL